MTETRPLTRLCPDDGSPSPVAPADGRAVALDPNAAVTKAFSLSVMISAVRCLLTYIVFPWVLPLLGVARGVGPVVGITVGVVAIAFNVASIRRFMRSGHQYRHWIAGLNVVVIGMLLVLIARDLAELLTPRSRPSSRAPSALG